MCALFLLLFNLILIYGYKIENLKEDPILSIKNGDIKGTIEHTRRIQKQYYSFKGIPYAQPPLGSLRFAEPAPADNWNGILDATKFKSACIQILGILGGTEDCLHINVYTPDIEAKNLPVMVWIHGGGFILGKSMKYEPDFFIEEENIIIVTLNYRFGIFGFLTTNDHVVPGNSGLKDQILALRWVQDNIVFFGGDPNAVTLFGQSAGSVSVSYLLQTPISKGLFRAAIMQSGTSLNLWSLARDKKECMLSLAKLLNITTTDSQELVDEFRKVDANALALAADTVESVTMVMDNPLNGLLYSPSIEPNLEGAIITGKSYEKVQNGEFQRVPTIIGLNSNEAILFMPGIFLIEIYMQQYGYTPAKLAPVDMNIETTKIEEVGEIIYKEYFPNGMSNSTIAEIIKFISEHQFDKGILKTVELQSKFAPVYMYYFSYYVNGTHIVPGAAHNDEMDYLWAENNKDDHPLTQKMVRMWTNFAKNINPTPEPDPILDNLSWEPYSNQNTYLNIGDSLTITSEKIDSRISFWDELYERFGNPPYDTY